MDFAEALDTIWNTTPVATREAIKKVAPDMFRHFNMDTPLVICHFMAQIGHESGNGKVTRENMSYSAERIMEVFGVGHHSAAVTPREAKLLARNPVGLAERVYGLGNPKKAKELGNIKQGDGYRYRGNGFLQLTGRGSHRKIGQMIGLDLETDPDLLLQPGNSFMAACAEYVNLKAYNAALADNIELETRRINGGYNGLAERKVLLRRWKEALDGIQAPAWAPRGAELDKPKTLMTTSEGVLGTGATAAGGVTVFTQIMSYVNSWNDTVSAVQGNAGQIVETVKVVKPFFGLNAQTWGIVGATTGVCCVLLLIGVLVFKFLKLRKNEV
jgi:putative chitinase